MLNVPIYLGWGSRRKGEDADKRGRHSFPSCIAWQQGKKNWDTEIPKHQKYIYIYIFPTILPQKKIKKEQGRAVGRRKGIDYLYCSVYESIKGRIRFAGRYQLLLWTR